MDDVEEVLQEIRTAVRDTIREAQLQGADPVAAVEALLQEDPEPLRTAEA